MIDPRSRIFGSDPDANAWVRKQGTELPSSRWVCTDSDLVVHLYKATVDQIGTREVQMLMRIEWKGRGGELTPSQQDTLFKAHVGTRGVYKVGNQNILNYGQSIVFLSGTSPDNSEWIDWGRFNKNGLVRRRRIDRAALIQLLRGDLHPDSMAPRPLRRHHKTREIQQTRITALGFEVEETVVKKS